MSGYEYDTENIPHGKYLTWTDHLAAAWHAAGQDDQAGARAEFLKQRALQRKDEADFQKAHEAQNSSGQGG